MQKQLGNYNDASSVRIAVDIIYNDGRRTRRDYRADLVVLGERGSHRLTEVEALKWVEGKAAEAASVKKHNMKESGFPLEGGTIEKVTIVWCKRVSVAFVPRPFEAVVLACDSTLSDGTPVVPMMDEVVQIHAVRDVRNRYTWYYKGSQFTGKICFPA